MGRYPYSFPGLRVSDALWKQLPGEIALMTAIF